MKAGFTLLETLVAMVVLGLVAAVAVPLTMRLGRGELAMNERLSAREWLLTHAPTLPTAGDQVEAVANHPGWWLHLRSFVPTSAPIPPDPTSTITQPPHHWIHLLICSGLTPDAPVLADRIVLVMSSGSQSGIPR